MPGGLTFLFFVFLCFFQQREEIMDLLLEFYKELKGTVDITYVSDVWLPEVSSLCSLSSHSVTKGGLQDYIHRLKSWSPSHTA